MPERRIGILSQLVPPKATWTEEKVPDQKGKTVIITGGNIGIGRETARVLLSKGAKVYIATRSADKAQAAIDELKSSTGSETIFFLKLNLADLDSVKTAAEEFIRKEPELHTLYNNRGITYAKADQTTSQGFDIIFGTNVLGHFYLTKLLLPVLKATAKNSPAGSVRIINMSSIAHYMSASEGIRSSTLGPETDAVAARKKLGVARLYGQSKLGNILFSNELARRYKDDGIVSISLFPGAINADLSGHAGSFWQRFKGLLGTLYHRAITSLYAGTDPEASRLNGKYLTAWARLTLPSKKALDPQLGTTLWNWCEEQVKKGAKVNDDVKAKDSEDTKVEEDSKPKVEEDIKVEDVTKVVEVTKAEEDTKPKEDIKTEEATKVDEATKAKEDTEAKDETKSKE
ncbi:hypothetical protein F5888DRAFT_1610400 [Russula emetica]|nr:hypothetical protein F5888DRAFT_1610400 [Russula emetica]